MSTTITIRLPDEISKWLEEESRKSGISKSRIIRGQLESLCTSKVRQPFLDLAGSIAGKLGLSKRSDCPIIW